MKEYKKRTYRGHFKEGRWEHFIVKHKETDLWIGIDRASYQKEMPAFTEKIVRELRKEMEAYLETDPAYVKMLAPYPAKKEAPRIFHEMSRASRQAGIGPMGAVAGAVAHHIADELKRSFRINEIVIENGGDIYADIREDIDISVFAGESPLSEKVGLHIETSYAPLGICTSSGTVGPSLSFGKADAVMIICKDVLLADCYATAFGNTVQTAVDVDRCLERIARIDDIISAMVIKDDKMGVIGQFEIKIF